jgi:hypothetical protein
MALSEDLNTSPKERVIDMLRRFPDDMTYADIRYHVYVLEQIEEGLRSVKAGPHFSQSEMEMKSRQWLASESSEG